MKEFEPFRYDRGYYKIYLDSDWKVSIYSAHKGDEWWTFIGTCEYESKTSRIKHWKWALGILEAVGKNENEDVEELFKDMISLEIQSYIVRSKIHV